MNNIHTKAFDFVDKTRVKVSYEKFTANHDMEGDKDTRTNSFGKTKDNRGKTSELERRRLVQSVRQRSLFSWNFIVEFESANVTYVQPFSFFANANLKCSLREL